MIPGIVAGKVMPAGPPVRLKDHEFVADSRTESAAITINTDGSLWLTDSEAAPIYTKWWFGGGPPPIGQYIVRVWSQAGTPTATGISFVSWLSINSGQIVLNLFNGQGLGGRVMVEIRDIPAAQTVATAQYWNPRYRP